MRYGLIATNVDWGYPHAVEQFPINHFQRSKIFLLSAKKRCRFGPLVCAIIYSVYTLPRTSAKGRSTRGRGLTTIDICHTSDLNGNARLWTYWLVVNQISPSKKQTECGCHHNCACLE